MKNIKRITVFILSIVCLFTLFGCGSAADGNYVDNSIKGTPTYYSSLGQVSASVSFDVYLPDAAKYEVAYTLQLFNGRELIAEKAYAETYTSGGNQTVGISQYWSVDYSADYVLGNNFTVRLSDFTAKAKASDTSYIGLSIGFGVLGGVVFIVLLVLYICLNKRNDKDKAV